MALVNVAFMASLAMLTPYADLNAAENPSELFCIGGPVQVEPIKATGPKCCNYNVDEPPSNILSKETCAATHRRARGGVDTLRADGHADPGRGVGSH
jgi:hypothetical protein